MNINKITRNKKKTNRDRKWTEKKNTILIETLLIQRGE